MTFSLCFGKKSCRVLVTRRGKFSINLFFLTDFIHDMFNYHKSSFKSFKVIIMLSTLLPRYAFIIGSLWKEEFMD
jgi:hypothetical protein